MNFPSSPTLNQEYSFGTKSWRWNGTAWQIISVSTTEAVSAAASATAAASSATTASTAATAAASSATAAASSATAAATSAASINDANLVHKTGDETVGGIKTFTSSIAGSVTGTAANVTGTVAIVNGGTGQTTRQNAMDALAGAVTSGQYLRGNGTDVVMSAIQAADVPTLNQNTTGTSSNVTGTVAVTNGGTGSTTASAARTALGLIIGTDVLPITNPSYTGTLTGGTGVVNLGSGQFYKDASGNVGIGTSAPGYRLDVAAADTTAGFGYGLRIRANSTAGAGSIQFTDNPVNTQYGVITASTTEFKLLADGRPMTFFTGGLERGRFDASGNFLVSKTSDTNSVAGTVITLVDAGGAGKHGKIKVTNTVGTGQYILEGLNASGGTVGGVTTTSTTTSFPTSSDYRLKENIAPMTDALSVVQQLKPCTYTWKSNGESTQGFIAHELQEVVPECVVGEKDAVDTEGKPVYQGIDTSFLVATLTAAIQEQQAIITALTSRVAALESSAI